MTPRPPRLHQRFTFTPSSNSEDNDNYFLICMITRQPNGNYKISTTKESNKRHKTPNVVVVVGTTAAAAAAAATTTGGYTQLA
jgi:hypothetical protein